MEPILHILILDDNEERHIAFSNKMNSANVSIDRAYTAEEAINLLNKNAVYDFIFLDHDLGGQQMVESGPGTGYEVAQWLAEHQEKQAQNIILHTFNEPGARNMQALIPSAKWIPGIWTMV